MAQTITRRLYASTGAAGNDLAHFDVTSDSYVCAIDAEAVPTAAPSGLTDRLAFEVSTTSAAQGTTNDALNILLNFSYNAVGTTSGISQDTQKTISGIRVYVPRGTRIYLHSHSLAGTPTCAARVNVHLYQEG